MPQSFEHKHSAHCESGVMSLMMRHHGLDLSEAMVFGLAGALSFAYLPFIKLSGLPLIAYRGLPRAVIKGLQKNIGLKMELKTFSKAQKGQDQLDKLLDQGKIVGAQTSVFWLPYFPEAMRFHFNAHNLIVYKREAGEYLISDPVFEAPVRCTAAELTKARFVKGVMAPKGLLYYPAQVPKGVDYDKIIPKTIKNTAKMMLKTPVPIAGIRGIKRLARRVSRLSADEPRYARLFLGHIIRMQEEIGTGGAGFRFIYASFLQEAGALIQNPKLTDASQMMTAVGDKWRAFALISAKAIRNRPGQVVDFNGIAQKLQEIAQDEAEVYQYLLNSGRK